MVHCEGIQDWMYCLKCEFLCTDACPIQRGDIEELVRQLNNAEAHRANFFIGGLDDTLGNA
jgi:hypothetical protein